MTNMENFYPEDNTSYTKHGSYRVREGRKPSTILYSPPEVQSNSVDIQTERQNALPRKVTTFDLEAR
jgi:hypothetical protein